MSFTLTFALLFALSVREMNDVRFSAQTGTLLTATGTIQSINGDYCRIEDKTGRSLFRLSDKLPAPRPGDFVVVTCQKAPTIDHDKRLQALKLSVIGTGTVSPPKPFRLDALDDRQHDLLSIITEGTVVDVVSDEVDARYDILLLKDGATRLPLFVPTAPDNRSWIGARIRVLAQYDRLVSGIRRFSGPFLSASAADITVLTPPPDPFAAPPLDLGDYLTPQEVAAMDRRTIVGVVLATWDGRNLMLRSENVLANVQLTSGRTPPPVGSVIKATGYPEADLYKINLVNADWMRLPGSDEVKDAPRSVALWRITHRSGKNPEIDYTFHGQLIRLTGTVHSLPASDDAARKIVLNTDGERLTVDFSSCPDAIRDVLPGCEIEVTGRCFLDVAAWRPYDVFPQITGVTVILRTADDLRIFSRPSWWTPVRLLWIIGALAVLLVGFVIWNRFLNRLVERRGRQLYRADIERASESLRVEERTRLAVELHDSLSQYLTGVALQIKAGRHELAAQALKSCRDELRNCLWDLRSNAIDSDSMNEAIRQTLAPHAEDVSLAIRFNVPRRSLSDNTAYAILRIIRELVVNAIRHGGAANIRIAGSREPERLLFSVKDDGCGFDPDNHPGIGEGHFGLQGVTERVASLGGEISIESHPDEGTKVVVVLPLVGTTAPGK
jgi:signal transduction histidine kinase